MTDTQKKRSYAFDFDGVIAQYNGFKGSHHAEAPIAEVVQAMRLLKEEGHTTIVHSTRGTDFLKEYCESHDIPADYYNENPTLEGENPGKPIAYVYVDDRAVCYKGQSAEDLVAEIQNFKAYWQE
ncbi:MAG: hypothetical protein LR017_03915 [Candidatus Pacebacteria bacterium]|nr:hypothetical protein [Candidatus Paceibacterota bacterium]